MGGDSPDQKLESLVGLLLSKFLIFQRTIHVCTEWAVWRRFFGSLFILKWLRIYAKDNDNWMVLWPGKTQVESLFIGTFVEASNMLLHTPFLACLATCLPWHFRYQNPRMITGQTYLLCSGVKHNLLAVDFRESHLTKNCLSFCNQMFD